MKKETHTHIETRSQFYGQSWDIVNKLSNINNDTHTQAHTPLYLDTRSCTSILSSFHSKLLYLDDMHLQALALLLAIHLLGKAVNAVDNNE